MFKCDICNREFKTKQGCSIHKLHQHNNKYENAGKKSVETRKNNGTLKLTEETKNKISKSRKKFLQDNPDKVPYLINHSSNISYPEQILIKALKDNDIVGWTERYQNGIYQYDIAFPLIRLDIEVDGSTHNQEKVKLIDKQRDLWSISQGWEVLRFSTTQIYQNLDYVIEIINNKVNQSNVIDIYDVYEIPCYIDYKQLKKSLQDIDNNKKILNQQNEIREKINLIINSNIDFSKFGWVQKVSEILEITPQNVNKWMKRNMLEFYNTKCFKRNT